MNLSKLCIFSYALATAILSAEGLGGFWRLVLSEAHSIYLAPTRQ